MLFLWEQFLFQQVAGNGLEVWITVNQDSIVLNGSGCDQRIDGREPGSCRTAEFNGFQTESKIY